MLDVIAAAIYVLLTRTLQGILLLILWNNNEVYTVFGSRPLSLLQAISIVMIASIVFDHATPHMETEKNA
jgi:hypothetical protein